MSERGFEWLVGGRYLRPRTHNRFVSFISTISMVGVAVGVAVLIVVLSVMNGFESELRQRILGMTAHGSLLGLDEGLPDWRGMREAVESDRRVVAAAPFVEGEAMLMSDAAVSGAMVRGILPGEERRVSTLPELMLEGRLEQLQAGEWRIVLGSALARELGVGPGDRVVLAISQGTVTPAGVVPRLRRFTVTGVFEAGMYEFDRSLAFMHMEDAAKLWRLGDAATGLRLSLRDMFAAPVVVRELAVAQGGGLYVTDWTRQHANFFRSIHLSKQLMFTILLLVVAVAAFNIISGQSMAVTDKRSDIAILRTMGALDGTISRIFLLQGFLISGVGIAVGLAVGVLTAHHVGAVVATAERWLGFRLLEGTYFVEVPSVVLPQDLVFIAVISLTLCLISAWIPARRAAALNPVDGLHG
jgi:lipoprotein-releasing system permease protein